jgi:hypothetical protein
MFVMEWGNRKRGLREELEFEGLSTDTEVREGKKTRETK